MNMDLDLETVIKEINQFSTERSLLFNGPLYQCYCKLAADLCFKNNRTNDGIYYLSESHGCKARNECTFQYQLIRARFRNPPDGLDEKYIVYDGYYAYNKYEGLLSRLREMPKEWTIVQITLPYDFSNRWKPRPPNTVLPTPPRMHLVRYSCGSDMDEPYHIFLPKPRGVDDYTHSLFQWLHKTTMDKMLHLKLQSYVEIKNKRLFNADTLKTVIQEITTSWLQEWCPFLIGRLYNTQLENTIKKAVDDILQRSDHKVSKYDRLILHQMALGCAHVNEEHLERGLSQIVKDEVLRDQLLEEILRLKEAHANLVVAQRHPVILILDEKIECVPWESTIVLRRHPVSRIPSVHFIHALFKKHEDTIVDGNKILTKMECGYYIVNPDQTLQSTEDKIVCFLKKRMPQWEGMAGTSPTSEDFLHAITKYNIFLYCGHGNGTRYLNSSDIGECGVSAIPLLFGCSSLQYKDSGGRVSFTSLVTRYLIAGSACMLGMLWPVTNNDADVMAMTLLNHWLPGDFLDLKTVEGLADDTWHRCGFGETKEPELLRALRMARDSAMIYTNSAGLIVYGLPTKIQY